MVAYLMAKKQKLIQRMPDIIKSVFPSYREEDKDNPQILLEVSQNAENWGVPNPTEETSGAIGSAGTAERDRLYLPKMPDCRKLKYTLFEEMASDSTISTILDIHVGHAFSTDLKTGKAITLEPISEEYNDYVKNLQAEVVDKIDDNIRNWGRTAATFGVNYVRVHTEQGEGITNWEWNYYTLPGNIREYERCGGLAGYTSEHLTTKEHRGEIELADPWALVSLKLPNFVPSHLKEPVRIEAEPFSLFDDLDTRLPIETQDYGVSLLENCYESWCRVMEGLDSLMCSRKNASHIDRLVSVATDNLDPVRAAEYLNLITEQLKKDKEQALRKMQKTGVVSTVWNSVIPVMAGSAKGGVNIDTHTIDPNISHIEDILFQFKRLCGAAGIEPSMVGFSDMLSGGLGDGGFLRTSIQAALKAHLLRTAAYKLVQRSIDIHTMFRDGKVWTPETRPYRIKFNSMSTAIALEEESAKESRANYAMIVTTLLEQIEQGAMGKSESFKTYTYNNMLEMDSELSAKIISELAKNVVEDDNMMESLRIPNNLRTEQYIRDVMMDVLINGADGGHDE